MMITSPYLLHTIRIFDSNNINRLPRPQPCQPPIALEGAMSTSSMLTIPPLCSVASYSLMELLEEARRIGRLGEVLSSNVRRRAEGRVIFRA
jgi:hypothetical protein